MAENHMTKPQAHAVALCTLTLAPCLMLAQQNAPNTQGVTPPPGSPTPAPARMTFFVTSVGLGKGGDLGGLAGALYAPLVQFIEPSAFGLGLSFNLLLMVIVGGSGFFFGPFVGALIAVLLPEWTRISQSYYSSSTPRW